MQVESSHRHGDSWWLPFVLLAASNSALLSGTGLLLRVATKRRGLHREFHHWWSAHLVRRDDPEPWTLNVHSLCCFALCQGGFSGNLATLFRNVSANSCVT